MRRSFLFAAALAAAMGAVAVPAMAQGYGATAQGYGYGNGYVQFQYNNRYNRPRPVLSRGQIIARIQAAGYRNVRGVSFHGRTYTAIADRIRYTFVPSPNYRTTYILTLNARTGAIIASQRIGRRY